MAKSVDFNDYMMSYCRCKLWWLYRTIFVKVQNEVLSAFEAYCNVRIFHCKKVIYTELTDLHQRNSTFTTCIYSQVQTTLLSEKTQQGCTQSVMDKQARL